VSKPPTLPLEISAEEAAALACPDRPLIDIRDDHERLQGSPSGAVVLTEDELLEKSRSQGGSAKGFLLCAEGVRSLAAARSLHEQGFTAYRSVAGGFLAWQRAGLPVGYPDGFDALGAQRYARHLVMPQVGPEGQHRLQRSRMLLVGLGGLNAPAALYLAAAGVGRLGLIDPDRVERSNLQRQVIHGESMLGCNKAVSAQARIRDLNPDVETVILEGRVDQLNADGIVADWDIVLDGTDNFAARYALNEACVRQGKPLVYGAVMRFQGQVSVFWPGGPKCGLAGAERTAPCFSCLFPEPPDAADAPGCAVAGVLGVLPGIVGTLQASEALKLALGIGQPLTGRLLLIDALSMEFRQARLAANPECAVCAVRPSRS
jgi:molybdopterin/thiamine biosynthesis adenylyltransferase/rhodanese-related sulfurtransferase